MRVILLLLLAVIGTSTVHSQTLEQQKALSDFQAVLDRIDEAEVLLKRQANITKFDCLKAFGNEGFCGCVSQKLPMVFSFRGYIAIVTRSKEENGYAMLDPKTKVAYDKVPAVRDRCVNWEAAAAAEAEIEATVDSAIEAAMEAAAAETPGKSEPIKLLGPLKQYESPEKPGL